MMLMNGGETEDDAAQAFVDADGLTRGPGQSRLTLYAFPRLTRVPLRISKHVRELSLGGCTSLVSAMGVPAGIESVNFFGCTSLTSVEGLPVGVQHAVFSRCTSLTSLAGLPSSVRLAWFTSCRSLISVDELPQGIESVDFRDCSRCSKERVICHF